MWEKRKKIWSFLSIIAIIGIIGLISACSGDDEDLEPDYPGRVIINNFGYAGGLPAGSFVFGTAPHGARQLIFVAGTPTAAAIPARAVTGNTITLYVYQVLGYGQERTFRRFAETINLTIRTLRLYQHNTAQVSWGAMADDAWRNTRLISLIDGNTPVPVDFHLYFENTDPGDPGLTGHGCGDWLCQCDPCLCPANDPACFEDPPENCAFTNAICTCVCQITFDIICNCDGIVIICGTPPGGGPCGPACSCALIATCGPCMADCQCGICSCPPFVTCPSNCTCLSLSANIPAADTVAMSCCD